ncbi:competence type IV pilus minor pilin ComGD [Cytobacillus dafuensis]|uniref:Type II secretion system protein n=1 Tax=Cytobacillus dafuensis TaxID=1742359 RepID=A0A5B8Z6S0_CYTDA|nr:competence type IV pilus minor pilin ComGD [Cytobacillus dafuensis]QED48617.1 type II secretion system protein [Cytobacillus dafuensis]
MRSREAGFTLIESLFVLSVFFVITSFSVFLLKPQFSSIEKQQFFSQLKSDFLFAQQYAISHQTEVIVYFPIEYDAYYIHEKLSSQYLIEREIPERIKIQPGSMKLFFQFQADGNISKFGSFWIFIDKERYKFTFLIGKGRFYVQKE